MLLIGRAVREIKFAKTNQKHYPVGWVVTRYQYGFLRSFLSDVILQEKYWWCYEMSAVFLDCVALRDTTQLTNSFIVCSFINKWKTIFLSLYSHRP